MVLEEKKRTYIELQLDSIIKMRENANNHETESSDSDDSFDKYTTIKQKWLEDYRNESYGNDKWPVEDQTESAPQPTNVHAILKMVRESSTFTIETQRAISSVLNMSSAATPIPSQPKTNWFPNTVSRIIVDMHFYPFQKMFCYFIRWDNNMPIQVLHTPILRISKCHQL